jgi:predicted polyphosphate/ATP-dependent NAD kinase
MKSMGFLVNPIAGMGGRVGLKGTDGPEILKRAMELGASPVSQFRAEEALKFIFEMKPEIKWLTASGSMGEDALHNVGYQEGEYDVVFQAPHTTSSGDTESLCRIFKEKNVDLILFCGGDGTARNIYNIINKEIPILGIPSGVKMFSAVFGINPKAAAEMALGYVNGTFTTSEAEIMDIDEVDYRKGNLNSKLYGYVITPFGDSLVQASKSVYSGLDEESAKEDIARYVVELMSEEKDSIFILGAGSTLEAIGKELGIEKTLLGVDVVKDGKLIAKDVNEENLLQILKEGTKASIIVGVIGAQGFVFGRGTQQISPEIIRKVGPENIKIVATPNKMLNTKILRVDCGDKEIDEMFAGHFKIIIGYHEMRMAKIQGAK